MRFTIFHQWKCVLTFSFFLILAGQQETLSASTFQHTHLKKAKTEKSDTSSVIHGFIDLHSHTFAEYALGGDFIWGTVDDLDSDTPSTLEESLPRCSGGWDHATLRPGYLTGLGLVSEELTQLGDMALLGTRLTDSPSTGDTGLHLFKRNGYDNRECLHMCTGPGTCLTKLSEEACLSADPGICQDGFSSNVSVSEFVSCETKLTRDKCEGSGYCRSTGSSIFSAQDDLQPCWNEYPDCDRGDTCLKSNPLKQLECNDLDHTECIGHDQECDWESECSHVQGSLTCSDLSKTECSRYDECGWIGWPIDSCTNVLIHGSLTCSDLNTKDCGAHSECGWKEQCSHSLFSKTLECGDLNLAECENHYDDGGCGTRDCTLTECAWESWGECKWTSLASKHCGAHFEDWPSWDTPTHQQSWWGYIFDAHKKGLQILSVSILSSNPVDELRSRGSQLPYDTIMDQLDAAQKFAKKYDSWVEIATSPAEARRIIADGKLALFLTVEAEFPFCKEKPCGEGSDETDFREIQSTLDEYQAKGLRGFQIVAHMDNLYSGVAIYNNAFHLLQWFSQELAKDDEITFDEFLDAMPDSSLSHFLDVMDDFNFIIHSILPEGLFDLDLEAAKNLFPIRNFDEVNDIHIFLGLTGKISGPKCVDPAHGGEAPCAEVVSDKQHYINEKGMTELGAELVRELMDRHMLIDLAHMSERGLEDTYAVMDEYSSGKLYPLYISHGNARGALADGDYKGPYIEKTTSDKTLLKIIRKTHGIFGQRTGIFEMKSFSDTVENNCLGSTRSFSQVLTYLVDRGIPVGLATDFNGMIHTTAPRFVNHSNKRIEERTSAAACLGDTEGQVLQGFKIADDPQTQYADESDFNTKGLGHVGLLGAFFEDLRNVGLQKKYLDSLNLSAENFVRMWERAESFH